MIGQPLDAFLALLGGLLALAAAYVIGYGGLWAIGKTIDAMTTPVLRRFHFAPPAHIAAHRTKAGVAR